MVTTFAEIRAEEGSLPIGRPIDNTRVYVLDRDLQLLPPGVPGEICVAGAGLARGYLGRPELTAERFVLIHGSGGASVPDGRSGALAPRRHAGVLRPQDDQVKVRGYRIEPGKSNCCCARMRKSARR